MRGGPVGDLIEASGRVEAGDFTCGFPSAVRREVACLTRAFNAMSARLSATELSAAACWPRSATSCVRR